MAGESDSRIIQTIALELGVRVAQVAAAIALLDDGSSVPFIARYRKEATDNLDDSQLRALEARLLYLRELEERRAHIMDAIESQGKLLPTLRALIESAPTKQVLEDLYLPYKQKRRTRAQIAREAGLESLADQLLAHPELIPAECTLAYVNVAGAAVPVADIKTALDGARDILSERFAQSAPLLAQLRERLMREGVVRSTVVDGKQSEEQEKFRDYYDYTEALHKIPSHRALALFRARSLGIVSLRLGLPAEQEVQAPHPCESTVAGHFNIVHGTHPGALWLLDVCRWTWRVKLQPHLETELFAQLREMADREAIAVFATNLREILLAAPAGPKVVLGLDPGIRTGCKLAIIDATGKLLATETIYPHEPRRQWDQSLRVLADLVNLHQVELIAIGNGTASRETDRLVAELIKGMHIRPPRPLQKIVVSEAGASIYSASELAASEFPDLDVSLRGAVSIARRLQDPLAELVKIEPRAIGVGQYQHDVNQRQLARSLDATVEDCVNAVGVDLNTASVPLLSRVSGLNGVLARNIVDHRDAHGRFKSRAALMDVARLGAKAFEQSAGFLRVTAGLNVLDASSVHPEAYPVVERILARLSLPLAQLMGKSGALGDISLEEFTDARFGLPTVRDIVRELEKPGRDPRGEFRAAKFQDGIEKPSDLQPGMILEGVVTNVAAFGAFVDIGVHQDGLVHVSALAERFVKDPHTVVKAGMIVKVRVVEVDLKRGRVALSMRLQEPAGVSREVSARTAATRPPRATVASSPSRATGLGNSAMEQAFAKLKR